MTKQIEEPDNAEVFDRLQRQIDLNFKRNRNASYYVETLRMDAIVLNRIAVQFSGKTVHEMIGERVIKEVTALKPSGLALKEIAQMVGFSNEDYLSKYLKKFPGGSEVLLSQNAASELKFDYPET